MQCVIYMRTIFPPSFRGFDGFYVFVALNTSPCDSFFRTPDFETPTFTSEEVYEKVRGLQDKVTHSPVPLSQQPQLEIYHRCVFLYVGIKSQQDSETKAKGGITEQPKHHHKRYWWQHKARFGWLHPSVRTAAYRRWFDQKGPGNWVPWWTLIHFFFLPEQSFQMHILNISDISETYCLRSVSMRSELGKDTVVCGIRLESESFCRQQFCHQFW